MEQLDKYLTDVHALEVQALAQMRAAPDIAGDPELARIFDAHREETERHEALIRERLEAHGEKPSRIEDLLGAVSGKGFVLFARSQPDTPGKLVTHAFSYEHMELAAYDLLARVAEQAGDPQTVAVAERIRAEEDALAARLAGALGGLVGPRRGGVPGGQGRERGARLLSRGRPRARGPGDPAARAREGHRRPAG